MATGSWFRKQRSHSGSKRTSKRARRRQARQSTAGPLSRSLSMEQLEDRRMLALFAVNNLGDLDPDDGTVLVGSLRQVVGLANANEGSDTIIFQDFLFNGPGSGVINLDTRANEGSLLLTDIGGVEIIGPGPGLLTVNAAGRNRIFLVDDGSDTNASSVTISGITLSGGNPLADDNDGRGGAILNRESLTLQEVAILDSSSRGGGAIFNDTGSLQVERSLIKDNTSQFGGGGIQNGLADQTDNLPRTTIVNSTITGNTATGTPVDGVETGYGGGVLNLAGTVNIEQSTLYGNGASFDGGGVSSQGFDPETDDESGEPTVTSGLATTNIRSTIIVGNTGAEDAPNDVGSIGMVEGEDGEDPMPFEPQINSLGFNLFGVLTHPDVTANENVTLPPNGPGDIDGVDPTSLFIDDPFALDPVAWLNDFGGVLPVFMPDINKVDATLGVNLAIDLGDPLFVNGEFDQRGFQFVRAFDATGLGEPFMDIGAAEVQLGNFTVNTLIDEVDGRFSDVPVQEGAPPNNILSFFPDLSLREAIEFSLKNEPSLLFTGATPPYPGLIDPVSGLPFPATITFDVVLTDPILNPDPTIATAAPTILLTLGELSVSSPVIIQGPTFDLEVDATGNDLVPGNNGSGSRVFAVFNTVEINNLILRGGNQQEFGGGIFTSGDLTLRNTTLLDNATTGTGGAIHVQEGTLLVDGTTIRDNFSSSSGGGIYVASGTVTVSNSTISGNTSSFHGGGIANADGNLLVRYSTMTLNAAGSTLGSGVASFRDASATTEIRSSIISGNVINDVQHVLPGTDNIVSQGYNVVGNGNAVSAGIFSMPGDQSNVLDPMLAPLARLGGPTPVHRLLPGSPAIDLGDPNAAGLGNVPFFDQRGFPFDRIELDPDTGVGRIDIGAFEIQNDVLLVGDLFLDPLAAFPTFVAALDESNLTPTSESIVILPSYFGEIFPSILAITDSVDIIGLPGLIFSTIPSLEILIDDGNSTSLLDVSIDNIRMQDNTRIVSRENLTLTNMQFVNNAATASGGAVSQQGGKLTISDSTFIGNSVAGPGSSGGAVHVLSGDLEINNSFLSGNTTDNSGGGKGGAVYIRDGNFTANYLYITGNVAAAATGDGGGIYGRDSTMLLTKATISGNSTTGSNSEGGGLAAKDSDITLVDPAVTFNTTSGTQSRGGGIFLDGGSLDVQNGNFFSNKTVGQFSSGGGIAAVNAEVTIAGTSINKNEALGSSSHGGGIYVTGGNLTVRESAVINNKTTSSNSNGGGIYSSTDLSGTQTTSIINSTISGNSTNGRGGGVYNAGGLTEIRHSTITANDAPLGLGGGVASYADTATTRTDVFSTIIASNTANNAAGVPDDVASLGGPLTNSINSLGFNLIGTGVATTAFVHLEADFDGDNDVDGSDFLAWQRGFGSGPGASKSAGDATGDGFVTGEDLTEWNFGFGGGGDVIGVVDPKLGLLADNGGPTLTHALLVGSPAIDTGDPAAVAGVGDVPLTDGRVVFNRVFGGRIDIGALEQGADPVAAATASLTSFSSLALVSNTQQEQVAPLVVSSYASVSYASVSYASMPENEGAERIDLSGTPTLASTLVATNGTLILPSRAAQLSESIQLLDDQMAVRGFIASATGNRKEAARDQSIADYRPPAKIDALLAVAKISSDTNFSQIRSDDIQDLAFEVEDVIFEMLGSDDSLPI